MEDWQPARKQKQDGDKLEYGTRSKGIFSSGLGVVGSAE